MFESNITAFDAIAVPTAVDPKSRAFISPTTTVAPSRIFNSSGVEVICVVLATAKTGRVPDWLGRLIVLSAVGSIIVRVDSCASAVAPSNIIAFDASIVTVSTVVVVPATDKLGTKRVPELGLYRNAPVSSNKALDSSWNTTGKFVFAVLSETVVVADKVAFATVVPAITDDKELPLTVIASASSVPSISASPLTSNEPASSSPVSVIFLKDATSLFASTVTVLLATTVPTEEPVSL